ncbi:MAG: type II secretion system protein, partial [Victivallales bacterium]|nr:type II secretion system protein [Victivallales bacterium]
MQRSFTFLEMIIVAAILALVSVFALPRLASTPRRLLVESALTSIRQAFNETATRARATGTSLDLTLDVDSSVLQVSANSSDLPQEWTPNMPTAAQESNNGLQFIANLDTYELSSDLEWLPEETGVD